MASAAAAFSGEVRDAARSMARFSDRGRMVPEFAEPEFRKLLVRSYRLVYTVHILAFIHGAQDLEHWRGRERG